MIRYRRVLSGIAAICVAGSFGLGLSACGKKKMMPDPVTLALMMPGVRVVVIPKQRNDLRIVVPPCSAAQVSQGSTKTPPGSNEIVVPQGALTQTVAVQPCPPEMMMSGGMMMMPPPSSTVLLTPGGTVAQQVSGGMAMMMMSMQNQLVIPENSSITEIILAPCSTAEMMGGGMGMMAPGSDQSLAAPTGGKGPKVITAPPCTAPPAMM